MAMKKNDLKGKNILVTGATSGIGKGICIALLSQGARVIGIGRDESKVSDLSFEDNKFLFLPYDLNNIDGIEGLFQNNSVAQEKLDGLVLCAGKEETVPLSLYKGDKIKSLFNLNLFSGIELLRIFSKKKFSKDNSSVVFFSSVMGELGQPGKVGYCATKSAVLGVVNSASLELAKRKIRVNAVSPGVVATPMTKKLFSQLSDENVKQIEEMHPLGIGQIEDVVPTVLFLLSDDSKWITGQNIKIDGGYSIQ